MIITKKKMSRRTVLRGLGVTLALPLLDGMVLLWATERCYLDAWKYSRSHSRKTYYFDDADGGALNEAFIPNWTSPELEKFVADIARFTDELARRRAQARCPTSHPTAAPPGFRTARPATISCRLRADPGQ